MLEIDVTNHLQDELTLLLKPLNVNGANMHSIPMLTENYGIERVNYQ